MCKGEECLAERQWTNMTEVIHGLPFILRKKQMGLSYR